MKNNLKTAAEVVAKPIIDYLKEKNPKQQYNINIKNRNSMYSTTTTVTIKEEGLFGFPICEIYKSESSNPRYTSLNKSVLQQQKLEEIMQNIDVKRILDSVNQPKKEESDCKLF